MRSVCVFCGSHAGEDPRFAALAQSTGAAIAKGGFRLVYGGAEAGLMGRMARAALAEGGEVLGVIPEFLIPSEGLQEGVEPRITATLAARKALLVEEADAFLILPGGAGTLEEVFDMIMLRQLGRHDKPAVFLDSEFWGPLQTLLHHVVDAGFAQSEIMEAIRFHDVPETALDALGRYCAKHPADAAS